jgi:inorganic pyrophosphatase
MAHLERLPAFADGDIFHVVVESPRGSTVKLKFDPSLNGMTISRPLSLGLAFPYDWGVVPSSRGEDGDWSGR